MATTPLLVNGNTYNYPLNNDNAPWGEDSTAWSVAVTEVLNSVVGTGDIVPTVALIVNNQVSPANITGLIFSPTIIRGAIVEYVVYRNSTGSGATEAVEVGTMYVSYKSVATQWDVAVIGGQGASVTFSITNAGQIQYTSSNFTGSTYSGTIKFRARAFVQ